MIAEAEVFVGTPDPVAGFGERREIRQAMRRLAHAREVNSGGYFPAGASQIAARLCDGHDFGILRL